MINITWENILNQSISKKRSRNLYRCLNTLEKNTGREIQINKKKYINFASNDYLGLSCDKRIIESGYKFSKEWGVGSGASRLVSGTLEPFTRVEKEFVSWINKEWIHKKRALFMNSGYNANIGILSALANRDTVIFCDRLNHASIYDGAILSRAKLVRFPHRDMAKLEKKLKEYNDWKQKIIIVDSLFSMEGDISKLKEITNLAKKYDALTIVDEAHSIGVFGNKGRGLCAEKNLLKDIDIIIGTLGKAFGVFGAFILSDNLLIEYLINTCRPFIFTTALPPFILGSVIKALEIIKTEDRGKTVLAKAAGFRKRLKERDINFGASESQIIPVIVGENEKAMDLMNYLMDNGIFAPAIRPPTIPPNMSRVRLSISFYHTPDDLDYLADLITGWVESF